MKEAAWTEKWDESVIVLHGGQSRFYLPAGRQATSLLSVRKFRDSPLGFLKWMPVIY
jgi:hypothetical protein